MTKRWIASFVLLAIGLVPRAARAEAPRPVAGIVPLTIEDVAEAEGPNLRIDDYELDLVGKRVRFVAEVESYAPAIRGAECDAAELQPIDPLIDQVTQVATERMTRLGMWQGDIGTVLQGLADEAHETLGGGFLVRLDCRYDPHRIWVATIEEGGQHNVVGLTTLLPRFIGGEPPARDDVADRLNSRSLGLASAQVPVVSGDVDPWLPFPVEEF